MKNSAADLKKTKQKDQFLIDINAETNIADLVSFYPETADVLLDFGLHCVGCFANAFDTIGQGAKIHGFHDEEIKELIDEVKKIIRASSKKIKKSDKITVVN